MIGLRQKLILGFGGLLLITVAVGVLTMVEIGHLGQAIDIILRENYRSVIACQNMKESLERIDSGTLFSFAGNPAEGQRCVDENIRKFREALNAELANLTLPGEREKAVRIRLRFDEYMKVLPGVSDLSVSLEKRRETYFSGTFPLFLELKGLAQDILEMNQAHMNKANDTARQKAAASHRQMFLAIFASAVLAIFFGEDVAIPHARLQELRQPVIAIGVSKIGIPDPVTKNIIRVMILILTPLADPDGHVKLLGEVSKAVRDSRWRRNILESRGAFASGGPKPFREKVSGLPKAFDKGNII